MSVFPEWYRDQVEDYLAILRDSHRYSAEEVQRCTREQRYAEYRLLRQRLTRSHHEQGLGGDVDDTSDASIAGHEDAASHTAFAPLSVRLVAYSDRDMSLGYIGPQEGEQHRPRKQANPWDAVLKR